MTYSDTINDLPVALITGAPLFALVFVLSLSCCCSVKEAAVHSVAEDEGRAKGRAEACNDWVCPEAGGAVVDGECRCFEVAP